MTTPAARAEGLRVAILGAGMIGTVHRRAALLNGAQLVGVMASSSERSEQVAEQWQTTPIARVEELADLTPDVVHVCSPNGLHVEHVESALAAGAHVICEKPLAIDTLDARRLVERARAHDRLAAVPFVYRFHPLVREIRDRVRTGDFGAVQLIHGSYLQDWLLSPSATSWRVDSAVGGPSRAFADIGSHWCDLMEFITGERIASLTSATTITVPQRPTTAAPTFSAGDATGPLVEVNTEDAASMIFRTERGVLGNVTISQVSAGRKNRLWIEVDGAERSAVFDQENPETIRLGGEDRAEVLQRDPGHGCAEQRRLSTLPAGHAQGYAQCFENFVADVYRAVKGSVPDGLPTFDDGLRSAQIVDAVLTSADSGGWVDVPSMQHAPSSIC